MNGCSSDFKFPCFVILSVYQDEIEMQEIKRLTVPGSMENRNLRIFSLKDH